MWFVSVALGLAGALEGEAAVIRVPAEQATIQGGIDAASSGDTVLVAPGTYSENLNFKGKAITVASESGAQVTTIDGGGRGSVVAFVSGESRSSVLMGFTLQHGVGIGAGVGLQASSATIVSNVFQNNAQGSGYYGAGIGGNNASPAIMCNVFRNHTADDQHLSGVISFVNTSSPLIVNNVLVKNACRAINLVLPTEARPIVMNNTIVSNRLGIRFAANVNISGQGYHNNILYQNDVGVEADTWLSSPAWTHNLVFGPVGYRYFPDQTGTAGNISADPLFKCLPSDEFQLLGGSPCIDAGSGGVSELPPTDMDGNPRIVDGETNGVAVVDLGAYEFIPASPPEPCLYVFCPGDVAATAPRGTNAVVVEYAAPVAAPVATVTCSPPSGSLFSAGSTSVTCTAVYNTNSVSCSFTVTVFVYPAIVAQPPDTNLFAGQGLVLRAQAAGTEPLRYRWTFEGITIPGATNPVLSIPNMQVGNEGIYQVVVTNLAGATTSSVAVVRVSPSGPSIVNGPASLTIPAGSNGIFSVSAFGSAPISYQWTKDGVPLPGTTSSQLVISNAQAADGGSYRVAVGNYLGTTSSEPALLTVVAAPPAFIRQPMGGTVPAGTDLTLSAQARGTEPISYQWRRDGAGLDGATESSLTLWKVMESSAGAYDVVASNALGIAVSTAAQVTVVPRPVITQGLTNKMVEVGETVILAVEAVGNPALAYSWQFNGTAIPGTNDFLVLTNIQASQSGYYQVTVANLNGLASSTGRVSVVGPPARIIAWGDDSGGQTSVPSTLTDAVMVAGGDYHSVALRRNGRVVCWGYGGDGQTDTPPALQEAVGIAAGGGHNLAITPGGEVVAWGRNESGQTNVPGTAKLVMSVAAGDAHSLALRSSGTVLGWGNNTFGQRNVPPGLSGVRAIAAGRNHSLALRADGTVVGWGMNNYGQATPPPGQSGVAEIAGGYLHSAAVLSNGTVVVWGDNTFGQTNTPAWLSNVVAIAAGDFHTLALQADGAVVGWGDDILGQVEVPAGMGRALGIAAGYYHGLARVWSASLRYEFSQGRLILRWDGLRVLQSAPVPSGPFTDLVGPCAGYTNADCSAVPAMFFRLQP